MGEALTKVQALSGMLSGAQGVPDGHFLFAEHNNKRQGHFPSGHSWRLTGSPV